MSSASESARLLPDWSEFERDYVHEGVPHTFLVRETPYVAVYVDQGGIRIGARFAVEGSAPPMGSVLSQIEVQTIVIGGARYVEVSTKSRSLYPNFFGLAAEVVADVVASGADPRTALAAAAIRWETLLSRRILLSEERQAGLLGELWLLERLAARSALDAVDAWTGPASQAHDFRIDDNELEVKTTSRTKRVHRINGAGQLEPSPGCTLFLLSLQLADGGAGGTTLAQAVERVEGFLKKASAALAKFRTLLQALGYSSDDAQLYPRRYRLRSTAKLIKIGPGVPRLTSAALLALPKHYAPDRLGHISYEIDVEGLGALDGTPEFCAVIPPASPWSS